MTHSPTNTSNMDHESTTPTIITSTHDRPILPPISSMDGFFASRSWPPPATSLASTSLASPSAGSTSSNLTMHESNTLSSPLSRNTKEPWSPVPNKNEHPHNQPRLDYFTMTATASALSSAAENHNQQQQQKQSYTSHHRDHHYRQNSLPQISTFRKNSITNLSSSYHSPKDQQRYEHINTPPSSSSSSSINNINNNLLMNTTNSGGTNSSSNKISTSNIQNNNASIELVLTPNSLSTPSIRSIERDIEEVIRHCNSLADNMNQRKTSIVEADNYFSNPTLMRPWLDDMISRANEVLNALLRLRKHQLAAEYARLHRLPDHQHLGRTDRQEGEGWDTAKNSMTPSSGVLPLNSGRLRKRGKRPVFQGRCHSCNISETPEWRRGPDGARTLCNACGLHYAKLAKKKVKQDDVKKETLEEDRDDTSMK